MIKRTLFFGNPAYLSTRKRQLVVRFPDLAREPATMPIEDLGFLVLEHPQITITNRLLDVLAQHKTAVITCNAQHMPVNIMQPLEGHSQHSERVALQINASTPLKKQLWQQTVRAKILNQAHLLMLQHANNSKLLRWATAVKSGDSGNHEALAAAYYFQNLFKIPNFSRNQKGIPPNQMLNYGYAILRAVAARALVSTGLWPILGIFHHNKYNAYCLADDIMEPYRPFVDFLVCKWVEEGHELGELNRDAKTLLLTIPALDVILDGKQSPLMNAMSRTTNSLFECFAGSRRKLLYPEFNRLTS